MTAPSVSVLVVTGRAECQDWLSWNLARLQYPNFEIVFVSTLPLVDVARFRSAPVAHIHAAPGLSCGELRNVALRNAVGEYFVWMDDDDWQHPKRLQWLVDAAECSDEPWTGWRGGWLYDVASNGVAELRGSPNHVGTATAVFRTRQVQDVMFDSGKHASDARWIRALEAKRGTKGNVLATSTPVHALWSRHGGNLTPTLRGTSYPIPLDAVRMRVGPEAWGDSDVWFERLRLALGYAKRGPSVAL